MAEASQAPHPRATAQHCSAPGSTSEGHDRARGCPRSGRSCRKAGTSGRFLSYNQDSDGLTGLLSSHAFCFDCEPRSAAVAPHRTITRRRPGRGGDTRRCGRGRSAALHHAGAHGGLRRPRLRQRVRRLHGVPGWQLPERDRRRAAGETQAARRVERPHRASCCPGHPRSTAPSSR